MLTAITRTIDQIGDPRLTGVLWRSLAWAAVAFGLIVAGLSQAGEWVGLPRWLGFLPQWVLAAVGGALGLVLTAWLLLPITAIIASLYLERIARAVEARWYPGLPPATGAPVVAQVWDGVALGAKLLTLNLLALVLTLFIPGIGFAAGLAIAAYGIGRGLYVAVAMRRMDRAAAGRAFGRDKLSVLGLGLGLALMATVPLLNLLLPVMGTAVMVHVFCGRRGGIAA